MIHTPANNTVTPLGTAAVVGLCVAVQAYVFLLDPPLNEWTLNAAQVRS